MTKCKDCLAEGLDNNRPAPHPGTRCVTHHRAVVKARRTANHGKRVQAVYGLLPGEYDTILDAQGGVCAICRKPFVYKRGAVDHDHAIEKLHGPRASVRGIIHGWENVIIGRLRDDPEYFQAFIDYLQDPPARKVLL